MLMLSAMLAASLPAAEEAAIFKAAGFARHGSAWQSGNCDGLESNSYEPGAITTYRDLNADGRPEAIVSEGGGICYGNTGYHFWLVSNQADGNWKLLFDALAIPEILPSVSAGGWPDIILGARRHDQLHL